MLLAAEKIVCVVLVFIAGTIVFSYLNIVIRELPREEEEKSFWTRLKKGRRAKMSRRDIIIDILGGFLAMISVLYYGISFSALTVFFVFCVLVVIAFIDMETQYIPPELNVILALLGVLSVWTLPGVSILERLAGAFCISVPLILIVLLIPGGFGGGDIKMMAASGILLGWKGNVAAFFIALVLGGFYGIYLLASKKKGGKDHFAFGPFLSIGIAVSLYADVGTLILNRYMEMLAGFINLSQ